MRTDSAYSVDSSPSSEFSVLSPNDTPSSRQPDPHDTPSSPFDDNDGFEELSARSEMSFTDAEATDTDMMSSSSEDSSATLEGNEAIDSASINLETMLTYTVNQGTPHHAPLFGGE